MQIIAGTKKGKKLKAVKNKFTRPTSQLVKGALFNILGQDLTGKNFLDLFAGTGNIGLEALSRGAVSAVFVEKHFHLSRLIKENLAGCHFEENGQVFCLDAVNFLKKKNADMGSFDFIFLDPPYDSKIGLAVMQELGKNDTINRNVIVAFEHRDRLKLPEIFENLARFKESTYGDTVLSFYRPNKKIK